ncbi:MAG: hypothetical protein ACTSUB_07165 [Candidatus Thorarchaeota archaeon]
MGRPLGVTILAILQLLGALAYLLIGIPVLLLAILVGPIAIILALPFVILGIIGFLLFRGLWGLKSWAWMWTMIVNIIGILLFFANISGDYLGVLISVIIVVYLFAPGVKDQFR